MIFSIRDLSFELGSLLLEGWLALAARAVCALLILLAAWLVRRWLNKKGIPALLARSWYFTGTPILLRSFPPPSCACAASLVCIWPPLPCHGPFPAFQSCCCSVSVSP